MSVKSIHFPPLTSDDMVRALLDNRKTVTRRVVKMPAAVTSKTVDRVCVKDGAAHFSWSWSEAFSGFDVKMPYRPGDILYVRETWEQTEDGYAYKADSHCHYTADWKWRPSIHMPREAARIFLRVTDVRVERLQDVTEEDAIKEGCTAHGGNLALDEFEVVWHNTLKPTDRSIYGWAANPWVWVIEFERCERKKGD